MTTAPRSADLLTRFPWLKRALRSRAIQPLAMLGTLAVFTLAVLAGRCSPATRDITQMWGQKPGDESKTEPEEGQKAARCAWLNHLI